MSREYRRKLGTAIAFGLLQIAWIAALLAAWQIGVEFLGTSNTLYPTPMGVVQTFWLDITSGLVLQDLLWSLTRATVGFALGSALGIVLGILTARSRVIEKTIGLLIDILRPIPPIAIVPLFVLWFGLGEFPKYGLILVGVIPPVWLSTHLGLVGVKRTYIWTAQSLGVNDRKMITEIMLPAAMPLILAGLRTALGIAFYCLVAAEMAGAFFGLAYRIELANLYFRVDRMLEYLAVLGLAFLACQSVFTLACHRLFPWIVPGEFRR
jgi:ABC-type nitrate/sulfonate/bicarbonate transport system permease component